MDADERLLEIDEIETKESISFLELFGHVTQCEHLIDRPWSLFVPV